MSKSLIDLVRITPVFGDHPGWFSRDPRGIMLQGSNVVAREGYMSISLQRASQEVPPFHDDDPDKAAKQPRAILP